MREYNWLINLQNFYGITILVVAKLAKFFGGTFWRALCSFLQHEERERGQVCYNLQICKKCHFLSTPLHFSHVHYNCVGSKVIRRFLL